MTLSTLLKELSISLELAADPEITGISTLREATGSHLSYAVSDKHLDALKNTGAAAVLVTEQLRDMVCTTAIAVVVEDPELSMARASRLFRENFDLPRAGSQQIDPTAVIFPNVSMGTNVTVGKNSRIMSGVYLGDHAVVGDETIIHPNCVVYHHCRIGSRCIVHANTVIGSDGFGYAHTKSGEHVKIEQMGNVVVEDDVEIGSNTSIDRATFTSTVIGKGTKIDNLVHISHNVKVGEHTIIAGQSGIAGSTTLGRNVVMAAQSGATGHIKIADFTRIAGRGGVTKDTEPGKTYAGFPLMEHKTWLKLQAKLARLVKNSR
ncbi:MAG TPA: UDP-3-O-(3-hydroxymyristoyl)glucosamine N-acyltransferase [Desulfuromonadales bacterium]|nr:UDP-3-O-(3-hydroxymyristoyl)glucosamine N-acyltransferase [Desulfuromonadales bacterium]